MQEQSKKQQHAFFNSENIREVRTTIKKMLDINRFLFQYSFFVKN